MALIKCQECGSMISDHAITCPKCGSPTEFAQEQRHKKEDKRKRIYRTISTVFLGLLIVGIIVITFMSMDYSARRLDFVSPDFDGDTLFYNLMGVVGVFGITWVIARKRSRTIKRILLSISIAYALGSVGYIAYYNLTVHKPNHEFETAYCSKEILANLKGKKLQWERDIFLIFEDSTITFKGNDLKMTIPISKISDCGHIEAECSPEKLAEVFGDKIKEYFRVEKLSYRTYQNLKRNPNFYIIPMVTWWDEPQITIKYDGCFTIRENRGTIYGSWNGMGTARPNYATEYYRLECDSPLFFVE